MTPNFFQVPKKCGAILVLSTLIPMAHGHALRAYSVRISCQIEPLPACLITASVTGIGSQKILSRTAIILRTENVRIPAGIYDGRLVVKKGRQTLAQHAAALMVKDRTIRLKHTGLLWHWAQGMGASAETEFRWSAKQLPMIIADPELKHGSMEAIMTSERRVVATSMVYLVPAKGCWVREVQCQPH